MPEHVSNIPSVGDKKRKENSVAANNESSPPKKKYCYECSAEGCNNKVVKGGVCIRHGAKTIRCSVEECTNNALKGGVCWRHGAKKELKRCSREGCTNKAQKRGVCWTHGGKVERKQCSVGNCTKQAKKGGVCIRHGAKREIKRCSVKECTNQVKKGGVCIKHGAKVEVKRCIVDGCTNQKHRRGVCWRHRTHSNIAPRAQGNFLCGEVQGGGNQNDVSTVVEISDNEGEGGKKNPSPIAARKRKAGVGKTSETAASDDTEEDGPVRKRSKEPTPTRRSKRLATLSKQQDASDVAPTQGGSEEGTGDAMEDGDSWGGDGQNEYDCGGGDDGDVNSEEGKQSHVVPDEIVTTTGANDVEKDSEIQRLVTELKDANNTVDALNDRLKEMSNEFEAAQSRSKSEHEQQQSELKDLRNREDILSSQLVKKNDDAARLEASLRSKEVEMQNAVLASAAQLKEANDKVDELSVKLEQADKDGTEKIQRQINKFHSMQQEISSLQSNNLRLEQQLRSSKNEQDNLKSALAKAASKKQSHCTRSTSITSSRKRFSKKNRLVGVDSLQMML